MNKLKKDNRGIGIIDAILVLTTAILVITFFTFALGSVLDTLLFEFQSLSLSPLSSEFSDTMDSVLSLAEMFYIVLIFGLILFTTWFFKYIVWKHKYSRYDEEEEDNW